MSLDHQVLPVESRSIRPRGDAFYGRLFGWSLKWRGPQPFLVLEGGICAVTLPKINGAEVLGRLADTGCGGPAMAVLTQQGPRVAILAETDGLLPSRDTLPQHVEVLAWGTLLPLPVDSGRAEAHAEWLSAPDPRQRWLPSLDAVLASVRPR
ncbi:glycogen operon protein GlgX [Amycolatopsis sp. WAC 04182]|uniref:glycogen operon protein GlgX n=1 Tax=Amycolatopsis sp. WAC 04182 TaxID=2203198 RepID=UPI000F792A4C|nr:glycogen operon protein GlgX [Amycolatopsis sp. WAC 04182]RSN60832.1 glycogen operon protein GlgX [Amycolatopsis sp. WAC 04182]